MNARQVRIGIAFAVIILLVAPWRGWAQTEPSNALQNDGVAYLTIEMREPVDHMYVIIDDDYEQARYIENGGTVTIPAGEARIKIATAITRDISMLRQLPAGASDTSRVYSSEVEDQRLYLERSSYPVLHTGDNLLVVTDQDASVAVDGIPQGTGMTRVSVVPGTHVVTVKHPEGRRLERTVEVQKEPPRMALVVAYTTPSRVTSRRLAFVPGAGQLHKRQTVKGIALMGGFLAASIGGVHQHVDFAERNHAYENVLQAYNAAEDESDALQLGYEAEQLYGPARTAYWRRNILIGTAAGIYLYSILDAWMNKPSGGYRTTISEYTRIEPFIGTHEQGARLVVRF